MVHLSSLCGYHLHLLLVHAWGFNEHVGQLVWALDLVLALYMYGFSMDHRYHLQAVEAITLVFIEYEAV